jgi:hypothetical protein
MRPPASLRTVLWRVAGACAFTTALSFAPIAGSFAPIGANGRRPLPPREVAADLATLLPERPVAVVEGRGLGPIARGFLASGVHARLVGMESFRKLERTPEYAQLLGLLSFAQLTSGLKPAELAAALLGDELVAAVVVDGSAPGIVAAVRTGDADVAEQLVRAARSLALMNKDAPVKPRDFDHGGATGVVVSDKVWIAAIAGDLIAASSEALATAAIDRDVASGAAGAARPAAPPALVVRMRSAAKGGGQLRAALDLPFAASLKKEGPLLPERSDNLVGAMLLGDLLAAARKSDCLTAELELDGERARVALRIATDVGKLPPFLRSFGHARASLPLLSLAPRNMVATLSLRRDWAQFWEDRGALCDAKTERDFAGMKTNLGLFFGGRSLPDEILPQLDDEILFVAARQTYPPAKAPPTVRVPAFAFVWKTRGDAKKLGEQFAIGVNTFVGILNADSAQKRNAQLLPFVEPFEGVTVYGGRMLPDDDRTPESSLNYAPALAWLGDRIVLATSEDLLHDLLHLLKGDAAELAKASSLPPGTTAAVRVDGRAIAASLRENREKFVSDAVVEKGKTRAQAELEFDLFTEALDLCSEGRVVERVVQEAGGSGEALELSIDGSLRPITAAARTGGS